MNQDTFMKVAVYAIIAIVVILVIRHFLTQENFANEHHKHHHHHKHDHKHHHENKEVSNQPLNVGTEYTLNPDTDGWMRIKKHGTQNYANIAASDVWVDNTLIVNGGKIDFQVDTRNVNSSPDQYLSRGVGQYREFKSSSVVGLNDNYYVILDTIVPWPDYSGGHIKQIAYGDRNVYFRSGTGGSFGGWNVMGNST